MAWAKGTKLIFNDKFLMEFPYMKGKKAIFVRRFYDPLWKCIYVKRKISRITVEELWNKRFWKGGIQSEFAR